MSATSTITQPQEPGAPVTPARAELTGLLYALLLAAGLERKLGRTANRHPAPAARAPDELAAALSVAAALEPADQLFTPQDLLAAHLARATAVGAYLDARLGHHSDPDRGRRPLGGIAPGAAVPLALGCALTIAEHEARAAVAIVASEWLDDETTRETIEMARRRSLPLLAVGIGDGGGDDNAPAIDSGDLLGVHGAVREVLATIRSGGGARVLRCVPPSETDPDAGARPARARDDAFDPVSHYERWLSTHGFSKDDLRTVIQAAEAEAAAVSNAGADASGGGKR